MRRNLLVALAAAGVVALTGCSAPAAPAEEPTPPPPSVVAESPTPEQQLLPKRVVINAMDVELFDDHGDPAGSFTYFDATARAVGLLTDHFGSEPVVTTTPGSCCHEFPATIYTWGGFVLRDSERLVSEPLSPEFSISTTVAMAMDVEIETIDGLAVGDSSTDVDASHPGSVMRYQATDGDKSYEVEGFMVDEVDLGPTPETGTESLIISVYLSSDHPGGSIESIFAPASNFGE